MDPLELTLIEARAALSKGELGCLDYADALLQRCHAAQALNAWVSQDGEALRRVARAVDQSGAARDASLLLAGVPIVLKDNIDTASLPTSGGTRALLGRVTRLVILELENVKDVSEWFERGHSELELIELVENGQATTA